MQQQETLQILVLTGSSGEAARFKTDLATIGFPVNIVAVDSLNGFRSAMTSPFAVDLLLADSQWIYEVSSLRTIAPSLPVVVFAEGPEDHDLALRWIRNGALDCIFSKEPGPLQRAAWRALHLRKQREALRRESLESIGAYETLRAVVAACPFGICASMKTDA